ncbi:hypothetical protein Q31b_33950 [Novipirellula aureliae]|uniref:Uncharacterized protein n=1 Tax=Novipirellula aureliae TaxID=2527966 RepID=A0A5C6DXD7_9BACT|nr:hypothetical protein [Novipirellula aureliae]TWU40051.1 hypothetical protein Q31b_33950 [Novipirellula aureliae]
MNQNDLNRAVAAATGDTVTAVKRLGFMILDPSIPIEEPTDPVHGGRVIDWDDFDLFRKDLDEGRFDPEAALC